MSEELEPVDYGRCQAEVPNGHTFMTLGGRPGRVRCGNRPVVIAVQYRALIDAKNGEQHYGHMSLCADCLTVFKKQCPEVVQDCTFWGLQDPGREADED